MGKNVEAKFRDKVQETIDALLDVEFVVGCVRRRMEKILSEDNLQSLIAHYKGCPARRSYFLFRLSLLADDSKTEENYFRSAWNDIVDALEEQGVKGANAIAERIEE